jgi:hypothetical protein
MRRGETIRSGSRVRSVSGPKRPAATHRRELGTFAAGLALCAGASAHAAGYSDFLDAIEFRGFRAEASYTTDSNVPRAPAGDALRDRILGARVSAGGVIPLSTRTRAAVQGFAGIQKFGTYTGLSNNFIGTQADFFFRSSGEFGVATYGAFVRTAKEAYESTLRDGYRHAFGVTVQKPVTDRIQVSGGLTRNISDGKSRVFDAKNTSLRGNADWSLGRWDTVYFGAELRRGDTVSTAHLTPGRADIADAVTVIPDDAYKDPTLFAYRFKASTWIMTLGYNHAFSGGHSLDFSWRWARSKPLELRGLATASENSYSANQFSVAYLARF